MKQVNLAKKIKHCVVLAFALVLVTVRLTLPGP